jgi:hypothetical protein
MLGRSVALLGGLVRSQPGGLMEKSDRRQISLAGLGLIGAGAVLGLTLASPATAAPPDNPRPAAAPTENPRPDTPPPPVAKKPQ